MKATEADQMHATANKLVSQARRIYSPSTRHAVLKCIVAAEENATANDYDQGTVALDVFAASVGNMAACGREDESIVVWRRAVRWLEKKGYTG